MAASPQFKVYDSAGRYQAACKEPEAAVALAEFYGTGATVRFGHDVTVWSNVDAQSTDSYDAAAEQIHTRVAAYLKSISAKRAQYGIVPRPTSER